MSKNYTVKLKHGDISISPKQLSDFKSLLRFDDNLKSRISELFYLDLYIYANEFGVNPMMIAEEVVMD
jgi:hypothetical protein